MQAEPDSLGNVYADIGEIKKQLATLNNGNKGLKGQITKLSRRVETIELSGLQDQISRISDELKSTKEDMLRLNREFAGWEIDNLSAHMQDACAAALVCGDINNSANEQLMQYFLSLSSSIKEKANNSDKPLSLLSEFRIECIKCSDKYNLKAFIAKPS